jgi:hypothetical protein
MKLTIIPSDGAVYEDELSYLNLIWEGTPPNVHALQWQDVAGWIEYNDGRPNEDITVLPDWADNALAAWTVANTPVPPPPPTADQNKATAASLLQATDWTTIADVGSPQMSNPYLANQTEFIAYRNEVRQYAVYPVDGYIDWPLIPEEQWVRV